MLSKYEIGRRIAGLRYLKDMTLEDVAEKVHVSRSTILRYERGDFDRIKLPVLLSIAAALGVSPEYLSTQESDDGLTEALEYEHRERLDSLPFLLKDAPVQENSVTSLTGNGKANALKETLFHAYVNADSGTRTAVRKLLDIPDEADDQVFPRTNEKVM